MKLYWTPASSFVRKIMVTAFEFQTSSSAYLAPF
jgi:hypothetical protein